MLMALSLSACHSINLAEFTKVESEGTTKLPHLEAVFEDITRTSGSQWTCGHSTVKSRSPYAKIFYREVEKNISDLNEKRVGYIALNYSNRQIGSGNGWTFFSIIPPVVFNLFGMPASSATYETEMEVRILNNECKPVKIYHSTAENTDYLAMWWGYGSPDYKTAASLGSYIKALDQIKADIISDSSQIKDALNKETADKEAKEKKETAQPVNVIINNNINGSAVSQPASPAVKTEAPAKSDEETVAVPEKEAKVEEAVKTDEKPKIADKKKSKKSK